MSRSIKKPYLAVCRGSNKLARTFANRKLRKSNKARLRDLIDPDEFLPRLQREASNTYNFPTDGLAFYQTSENAIRLRLLSNVKTLVNCWELREKLSWRFYVLGYHETQSFVEWLGKPFTLETLLAITDEDARRFARREFIRCLGR